LENAEGYSRMQVQRGQSQEEIIQALRRQIDELTAANFQLREQLAHKEQLVAKGSATDSSSPHLNAIQWIKAATGLSQERLGLLIGVTRQTINRWEHGEPITDANRRRLFAVREVLERATLLYPTPVELAAWLDTPREAEGRTPAELLEMDEIDRARYLAVSTPSPRLARPPAWVRQPVPEAFRVGEEHRQEALPPPRDDELAALIGDKDEDVEDISTT
jgi:transcriptional regulator with XRE-family HTH domain